jgi:hypothetical protein
MKRWSSEKFDAWKIKQENGETYFTTIFGNPALNVVYFYEILCYGATAPSGPGSPSYWGFTITLN